MMDVIIFRNFKQTRWDYKTFISTFFPFLKLINYTVNETQWVISHQKLFLLSERFLFQSLMIFFLTDEDHHWLYFVFSVLDFWRSMVNEMESVVKNVCHQTLKTRNFQTLNFRKENFTKVEYGKLEIYDLSLL